jgi:hypothetical protein
MMSIDPVPLHWVRTDGSTHSSPWIRLRRLPNSPSDAPSPKHFTPQTTARAELPFVVAGLSHSIPDHGLG